MSEKEALQRAADEARKVARTAREFAGVLDEYAKYLIQPAWRARAEELRLSALNKMGLINNGLATLTACNEWVEESVASAAPQPQSQPAPPARETGGGEQVRTGRNIRIKMKDSKRQTGRN